MLVGGRADTARLIHDAGLDRQGERPVIATKPEHSVRRRPNGTHEPSGMVRERLLHDHLDLEGHGSDRIERVFVLESIG
jgi:hypothetical protein